MTLGSLFSGIGGFEVGFERAGFTTLWQVEADPYCRKVLARHFPNAERFNDVRECGAHNLKRVNVISGGFPCQDISNAGLRAGIDGERSGLWSEFARIVGELRPCFVVVENVAALLGRGISRVLGDLSTLGYDAEWEVISAADIGAPHLRERVWIVAYADGKGPLHDCESHPRLQCGPGRNAAPCGSGELADAVEPRLEGFAGDGAGSGRRAGQDGPARTPRVLGRGVPEGIWLPEPNVGRVAYGIPARVDRLKALGNAVVPQIPELIARRIAEALQ